MKKLSLFMIVGIVFLFSNNSSFANTTMSAIDLLTACTTADMHWVDFCNGYAQAAHDQLSAAGKICVPDGTTRTQIVDIFSTKALELIEKDNALAEENSSVLVAKILANEFPCN